MVSRWRNLLSRAPKLHPLATIEILATPLCPCCRRPTLVKSHEQTGFDGRQHILGICATCTSIVNVTNLNNHSDDLQKRASSEYFKADDQSINEVQNIAKGDSIDYYCSHLSDLGTECFLDFGAGRGGMAAMAARRFKTVYALEMNRETLKSFLPHLPGKERIIPISSLDEIPVPIDAACMWHVAEHLPDIPAVLRAIRAKMRPGAPLFFQVPMFRYETLIESHYTFLNRPAMRVLCGLAEFELLHTFYYKPDQSLTCLARVPLKG